ncbi:MAG: PRC-barrel domain-containing protein [Chitinophagales bacterium]
MKGRSLIGKWVVNQNDGAIIGKVIDMVLDASLEIESMVILKDSGDKIEMPVKQLLLGENAVLVKMPYDHSGNKKMDEVVMYHEKLGTMIITTGGKEIGVLSDLVFEPETGNTTGLEISDGAIKDFIEGRNEITRDKIEIVGENAVMVSEQD